MTDQEKIAALRRIDLFAGLSEEAIAKVAGRASFRRYAKTKVILSEAETCEFMYFVVTGGVKAYRVNDEGKETILALHGEGKYFGELSMIDGKTAPAAVAATEESVVALIAKADFMHLIHTDGEVTMTILKVFSARMRDAWRRIELMHFRDAAQRIRMLLLMMSEEHGRRDPDGSYILEMRLTHQSIADMTGLTRETVTRVLDRWKRAETYKAEGQKKIVLAKDFFRQEV